LEDDEGRIYNKPDDPSIRVLARNCFGYGRVRIPENIRDDVRKFQPEHHQRFWLPTDIHVGKTLQRGEYPDGRKYSHYLADELSSGHRGLPRRNGNGTVGDWQKVASDVFPLLPRSRSTPGGIKGPAEVYPRRLLYDNGRMKGFLACGGDAPVDKTLITFDPLFRSKKHPIYVDGQKAGEDSNPLSPPPYIFDRDEFWFASSPPGRGSP